MPTTAYFIHVCFLNYITVELLKSFIEIVEKPKQGVKTYRNGFFLWLIYMNTIVISCNINNDKINDYINNNDVIFRLLIHSMRLVVTLQFYKKM